MTKKPEHTAGPWTLKDDNLNNRVRVVGGPRRTPLITFGPRRNWDHIDYANAALVIGAPDMLAACLELIEADCLPDHNPQYPPFDDLDECPPGHDYECGGCRIRRRLLAAVAKATGEATK